MAGKVLRIDVVVDENGDASRKLGDLDAKVDSLEKGATGAVLPFDRLNANLQKTGVGADEAAAGLGEINTELGAGTTLLGGFNVATVAVSAAVAALVVNVGALAFVMRESIEHYIEQSGVLEVNRQAVDRLADSWEAVQFMIGKATVGNQGDFTGWIDLVATGLLRMGARIAANIELARQLASMVGIGVGGPATARRDINGDLTAAGQLQRNLENQEKLIAASRARISAMPTWQEAEAMQQRKLNDEMKVHELAQREEEKAVKAILAAQQQLAALQDHLFGRDAIAKAEQYAVALGGVEHAALLVPAAQKEMNAAMAAAVVALERAGAGASTTAAEYHALRVATTDWAAINAQLAAKPDPFAAGAQKRREAFRETEVNLMNQGTELDKNAAFWMHAGEIADAAMAKAADAVESVVPPVTAAANAIEQEFTLAFAIIGTSADAMAARVVAAMQLVETNRVNSPFFGPNFGTADSINRMQMQNAGLTIPQFATGVTNFSGGPAIVGERGPELVHLPRGSSVTPHERSVGKSMVFHAPLVDARGANFQDEAALDRLADKVQRRLAGVFDRIGH